jgi:hypothetical protein
LFIIIPDSLSNNVQLFKDGTQVSSIILTGSDVKRMIIDAKPYDFQIRVQVTQTSDMQRFDNSVMCCYMNTYPDQLRKLFSINIHIIVPAESSDDDEPVDPVPEYSDTVVCDYSEEVNPAKCDHI